MNQESSILFFAHSFILILIVLFSWLLSYLGKWMIRIWIPDVAKQFYYTRIFRRIIGILGAILFVGYLGIAFGEKIIAGLTVVATALVISLREAVLSIFGWLHILIRAPYQLGDRIELNQVTGDVLQITLFNTTVMEVGEWSSGGQSTGRLIQIPNNWVMLYAVKNYTHGFDFIWNELSYTIAPHSNWERAREMMQEFAEESSKIIEPQVKKQLHLIAQDLLIHWTILTPFVYVKHTKDGTELTLRYLCKVLKRRATEHAFHVTFIEAFEKENIELA